MLESGVRERKNESVTKIQTVRDFFLREQNDFYFLTNTTVLTNKTTIRSNKKSGLKTSWALKQNPITSKTAVWFIFTTSLY